MTDVVTTETSWYHPYYGVRPWSRHGLVLSVAGFMYVALGFTFRSANPTSSSWTSLIVARDIMPLEYWGYIWMIIGLATVISARWPPTVDKWGYMMLTGWASGWGAFYAAGVIFEDTSTSNWSRALVFWLVAFMWWAIAGLNNPPRVIIQIVEEKSNV